MKTSNRYTINVFATGLFVLLLISVVLFWVRWLPEAIFQDSLESLAVWLSPSGLVPEEIENDPNTSLQSRVHIDAKLRPPYTLGLLRDLKAQKLRRRRHFGASSVYYLTVSSKQHNIWDLIYFDRKLGLCVYCEIAIEKKWKWDRRIILYAGPNGVSQKPEKAIGRFIKPLANRYGGSPSNLTLYDRVLRRFFHIRFDEKTVDKGPLLAKEYNPVEIGDLVKNSKAISHVRFSAPLRKATEEEAKDRSTVRSMIKDKSGNNIKLIAIDELMYTYDSEKYILILDKSGRIDKLNIETFVISTAGHLPPSPYFPRSSKTPRDFFAYRVIPFSIVGEYKGLIAATLSREGIGLTLGVFDQNGRYIKSNKDYIQIDKHSGGLSYLSAKYILENLQPAVFGLTSYFTASCFEATAGYNALLILPNSFVAFFGRYIAESFIGGLCLALLIISPSIILGALLAWRLVKDAAAVGLSKRSRLYWLIATICFGLSAYITYRLTRPKIKMVTCANCGRLRRPDMTRCHRCGSKWQMPELIPPTWRVIDIPGKDVTD